MFRDYRNMEALDRYDAGALDDRQYDHMDLDTRLGVEDELNRRDAREGRIAEVFAEDQEMERDDAHRRRLLRTETSQQAGMDSLEVTLEIEYGNDIKILK